MRAKSVASGLVGVGGSRVASFPVFGILCRLFSNCNRNLEKSGGSHQVVGVSLTRGGRTIVSFPDPPTRACTHTSPAPQLQKRGNVGLGTRLVGPYVLSLIFI